VSIHFDQSLKHLIWLVTEVWVSKQLSLQPCSLEMYAYQCDPYAGCEYRCAYCYALSQAETEWAREILVHQNYASQLQTKLSAIAPQTIYVGMNSDQYQPLEESCGQMRQTLELFTETGFSACILTKSDLVVTIPSPFFDWLHNCYQRENLVNSLW
jgi:DNA repair photolyase